MDSAIKVMMDSIRKMQRSLCQASVFFAWNTESGQHRIIDYDLPVEIATISNQIQAVSTRYFFNEYYKRMLLKNCFIYQPNWMLASGQRYWATPTQRTYDSCQTSLHFDKYPRAYRYK